MESVYGKLSAPGLKTFLDIWFIQHKQTFYHSLNGLKHGLEKVLNTKRSVKPVSSIFLNKRF